MRVLPAASLLLLLASCAGPGARGTRGAADAEEQEILDQVPTQQEAAAAAERDVNEGNANQILDEIRREVGGR